MRPRRVRIVAKAWYFAKVMLWIFPANWLFQQRISGLSTGVGPHFLISRGKTGSSKV